MSELMQALSRLFVVAMLVCGVICSDAMSQEQPNIIVILADDLGYSDLGCYGGEMNTPNIDTLAGGGVKLTQVYNSARCCPSRASLMTGLYPTQAGIGDFTTGKPSSTRGKGYLGRLRDDCVTMAEVLKPAGYGCYYVGKWHLHNATGPIKRGFDDFYGYTFDHSHDQYDADYYIRLPEGRQKEIDRPADEFYATDVFNDYAVEFIKQGQKTDKPWFLFLGHSSPHFPVQAPAKRADKYDETYLRGWDELREERFERMQKLGLIDGEHWKMSPREIVPVDRDDIANGFSGKQNPAWDSLDKDRQRDLARRMAVFAAMVEGVDSGVGQITEHLQKTGDLENTLIVFLSDNGACYEWGPFGFDGKSRRGETTLRTGDDVRKIGGRGTHQSYGSAWANLGNTPFRMYKHFTHEGGISTPFIAHWPKGIGKQDGWVRDPAHMMDVLPTLMEAAGAEYPTQFNGNDIQTVEGKSLLPAMRGKKLADRSIGFDHQAAHALRDGDWKLVYSKRMPEALKWELYNLAEDRCELNNLADKHPKRLASMVASWEQWATRVGVTWSPYESQSAGKPVRGDVEKSPEIAQKQLTLKAEVESPAPKGVVMAQGGREHGYALHFVDGKPAFDVRVRGKVTRLMSKIKVRGKTTLYATLSSSKMQLAINRGEPIFCDSPGLIPIQPVDPLSVGFDDRSAAGDYKGANRFNGKILTHSVVTKGAQTTAAKPKATNVGKPFQSELITKWGNKVTAENAWTEYPRPQMKRDNWTNLNGHWDYAITADSVTKTPTDWQGKILVPYCLESKLGGVQRLLDETEALWYRRAFNATPKQGKRQLLNFEAVDYRCEAFVNGKSVGRHVGGNLPFSFDVTDALKAGENELVVRVEDDTEKFQLRGKQTLNARGIWYTQVSGIWQTVWLEEVPELFVQRVKVDTKISGEVSVKVAAGGRVSGELNVTAIARLDGKEVARATGPADSLSLKIADPKLWTPNSPTLYDLELRVNDDIVHSYFGVREVGKVKDADGHWRFTLNGEVVFHWGPLDQGWWPDGLLTPPSDEAMLFDIEWLKEAGFNMIRKHIKVEPRRYYYHCDRLGMMVWQDQVSGGVKNKNWPEWTRLKPNPVDAVWPKEHHDQYMLELDQMITTLESHPSIVSWVPFNERWGQHQTMEVGKWTVERDPTRLINVASGGNFWPVGDVVDEHRYPHPGFPFELDTNGRFDDFIKVMGEFGGHGYPVKGHLWDANRRNWGYGDIPKTEAEYQQRYVTSLEKLNELRGQGIAAGVYTQTTDVEGEINGLMTYDRKVIKIPAKDLAEMHKSLFEAQAASLSSQNSSTPDTAKSTPAARTTAKEGMMDRANAADQFVKEAIREVPTDRKPGSVMDADTIRSGLKSHDRSLYIKAGWIRDPYISLGPDGFYYLTGTQPNEGDPREAVNPYNIGLGAGSIVGNQVRVYRSKDLIEWESLGVVFSTADTMYADKKGKKPKRIWAPEVHWMPEFNEGKGRWALVHCPKQVASLALSPAGKLEGPWTHPMGKELGQRHDPSLFTDNGVVHLLWQNTMVASLSSDLSKYTSEPIRIDPSGTRLDPNGKPISHIGHEGATMMKVGGKFVHLGTAWSTDQGRKGSYNLYYCVADKITGPYGPRKFAGRFLGHGTPFETKDGKWWCTAFFNANVPPESRQGIASRDIGDNARTINEQGVTIVPLDVRVLDDGDIYIRAKDPDYANPGPDEAQKF